MRNKIYCKQTRWLRWLVEKISEPIDNSFTMSSEGEEEAFKATRTFVDAVVALHAVLSNSEASEDAKKKAKDPESFEYQACYPTDVPNKQFRTDVCGGGRCVAV